MIKQEYRIVGLMSGTSLDGLDICYSHFYWTEQGWQFTILAATTVKYSAQWEQKLSTAQNLMAIDFVALHNEYGCFLGEQVSVFLQNNKHLPKPDYVSSHGHTVFHQPQRNITWQIGAGASLAAACGLNTISDFRTLDVALCGQGAPLVPIGDQLLFNQYAACLNLGGFANISFAEGDRRVAFDICPVNMILNGLANQCGLPYDDGGRLAAQGLVHPDLLHDLNNLPFYAQLGPKSLGREWVEQLVWPLIQAHSISVTDALRTFVEHIAQQIAQTANSINGTMLITGGGAYNSFLIAQIKNCVPCSILLPDAHLVEYKEALIFAFLGLLRVTGSVNGLKSVTGAQNDSCGGVIHLLV